MNEELQKALGELLGKANDGIDAANGFLASELPEVIQQLLMWHGCRSIFYAIILCVASVFIYRKTRDLCVGDDLERAALKSVGYCLFIFFSIAAVSDLMNAIQIWIAPKVWLIEYAAKLTN